MIGSFCWYIFGINMGIMRALGMHWALAGIMYWFLWFGALPTVIHFALQRKGGVPAMWHVSPVFYSAMNLAIILSYVTADWDTISA
jgi:hypothetical protein